MIGDRFGDVFEMYILHPSKRISKTACRVCSNPIHHPAVWACRVVACLGGPLACREEIQLTLHYIITKLIVEQPSGALFISLHISLLNFHYTAIRNHI